MTLPNLVNADSPTRFHGFVSQGFIYTSDNQFYGNSQSGSFEFTEVGLNASKRFSPRLRLSSQIISRVTGQHSDGDVNFDYLFLDYKAPVNESSQVGVRVGRVKNVIGFYNETRDVAFTRPSIFAPQSIYFDSVRDLQLSSDGLIGYGEWRSDTGTAVLEVGTGKPRTDKETEESFFGNGFDGGFHNEKVNQARIGYTLDDQSWRFALSSVDADLSYRAGMNTPFLSGLIDINLNVLSADYAGESFVLTAEYMQLDIDFNLPPAFTDTRRSRSWYFQVQHYITTNWSFYARYENFYLDKNDRNGQQLNLTTGLPSHFGFTKSLLVGAKWQPANDWMLMFEIQDIDGTAILDRSSNPDVFATKRRWEMLSLMLSYRF